MAQSAKVAPLPSEAYQYAAEKGLGVPLKEYKARFLPEIILLSFIIVLAVAIVVVGSVQSVALFNMHPQNATILLFLVVGLLITFGVYFHPTFLTRSMKRITQWRRIRVYTCTDGLLWLTRKTQHGARWDEVVIVMQVIISKNNAYQVSPPIVMVTAKRVGYTINRYFLDAAELGTTIIQETSRYLLPKFTARYQEGETVTFGKLGLDQQGLLWESAQLPWSQVQAIKVAQGTIEIIASDAQSDKLTTWRKINPLALPNSMLFLSLVETILKQKQQSAA